MLLRAENRPRRNYHHLNKNKIAGSAPLRRVNVINKGVSKCSMLSKYWQENNYIDLKISVRAYSLAVNKIT